MSCKTYRSLGEVPRNKEFSPYYEGLQGTRTLSALSAGKIATIDNKQLDALMLQTSGFMPTRLVDSLTVIEVCRLSPNAFLVWAGNKG